jgi:hypothetical protein
MTVALLVYKGLKSEAARGEHGSAMRDRPTKRHSIAEKRIVRMMIEWHSDRIVAASHRHGQLNSGSYIR